MTRLRGAVFAALLLYSFAGLANGGSSIASEIEGRGKGQTEKTVMATTVESPTISVRIDRPLHEVYDFLAVPENWNRSATGVNGCELSHSVAPPSEGSLPSFGN